MNLLWRIVALVVSRTPIAEWLIMRSLRTPYFHLTGYMERYWLFNRYDGASAEQATSTDDSARHRARRWPWLPSVRIHHILRADNAEHPHDHPWDARTIILKGGYVERRTDGSTRLMGPGGTARIRYGEYHHIEHVTAGGVWTLFITWDYQGTWGFLVNGRKVPWREYEATYPRRGEPQPETNPDRAAIRLLVAAGFVTKEKANEALNIAHGFSDGPLARERGSSA